MIRRALTLLAALFAAALVLAPIASASVTPDVGVSVYNQRLCAPNAWVRVKLPATEYTIHDSAGVCVSTPKQGRAGYTVLTNAGPRWTYPNINLGYEQGNPSCASARDTCPAFPVQEKDDGTPVASVRAWLAPGVYNLAFDVWFSPSKTALSYQERTNDTEVMVWLRDPGIRQGCDYHVRIDNINWCVRDGWAGGGSGKPWQRITFDAQNGRTGSFSVSNLWLNPLFRNAIAHHMLTPDKWLYAIDVGNELYSGGVGDNIHYLSLGDVR